MDVARGREKREWRDKQRGGVGIIWDMGIRGPGEKNEEVEAFVVGGDSKGSLGGAKICESGHDHGCRQIASPIRTSGI